MTGLPERWKSAIFAHTDETKFADLQAAVARERENFAVYPPEGQVFRALELTPPQAVRAVILGQDPYHEAGQATGLAFSVARGVKLPPSLRNIYAELESDLGIAPAPHGDLSAWAQQGVLLLNTVLTVRGGAANSHAKLGWQAFTDAILAATADFPQPIAFILWGAQAQKKAALLSSAAPRLLLFAPHPSPLSAYRGFFGSRPFSQCNEFLQKNGQAPIDWRLDAE